MAEVKICGLTTPDTLHAAVAAGAAYVGLVCFPKSPRHLAPDALIQLARQTPGSARSVLLTVDADDALLEQLAPHVDILQLHGGETPARAAAIRARFGKPVWRAVGVRSAADVREAGAAWRGSADALLLDAKPPQGSALPGGNGVRFDWRILAEARPAMPWVLAGGLDAATVQDAVRLTGARTVDVSSGVEDAPGVKSIPKIKAFIEAARLG